MTRLLIGDATSYKAVVLAAFVKEQHPGVEVFTYDPRPLSRFLHTRHSDRHFVLGHRPDQGAAFVDDVLGLVLAHGIDLLIPVNSVEVDLLLQSAGRFGAALSYCGSYDAFRCLNEKDRLQALAEECGVPVPRRFREPESVRFPAVAKPVRSSSALGVRYLGRRRDLDALLARLPDPSAYVFQEHVPGVGVGYSVFAAKGEIVEGQGHRRLAEYPVSGGSSVYRECWSDPRMRDYAERMLHKTGWSGFAMFEFKLGPDGGLRLLEANPRVWGSINQGLQNGADYLKGLLGPASLTPKQERRTYFSPFVYLSMALYLLRGDTRPVTTFLKNWRTNRADIGIFRDRGAWLGSLLRIL